MTSLVSVIIPCYNGERFLAEAIESVLRQTVPVGEIIVVDDGSTDATPQVAGRYPQVRLLQQQQQGVSRARNTAVEASIGQYIVFLDHDDRLLPNALETGLQAFRAQPESGFVFGVCRNIDADGRRLETADRAVLTQTYEPPFYAKLLQGHSIHPPARLMIQRQAFESTGGFDTSLTVAEDYDLYLRLAAAYPGFCHNQPVVEYRSHRSSTSSCARPSDHLLASFKVLDKQKPALQGSPEYEAAYRQGRRHWRRIYSPYLVYDLAQLVKLGQINTALTSLLLLLRYRPQGLLEYGLARLGWPPATGPDVLMR